MKLSGRRGFMSYFRCLFNVILPEGFEREQYAEGRFLQTGFLRVAHRHIKVPALEQSATFFVEGGHRWNDVSKVFERASTSETKRELKTLLEKLAETVSQISDIKERAFGLLGEI
jgi:hypothetical protein